jgi:hypothetical protein
MVTVPLLNVRQNIYVFGPRKINIDEKNGRLLAKPIGQGGAKVLPEPLEDYLIKQEMGCQEELVTLMRDSDLTLNQLMEALARGEKIRRTSTNPFSHPDA